VSENHLPTAKFATGATVEYGVTPDGWLLLPLATVDVNDAKPGVVEWVRSILSEQSMFFTKLNFMTMIAFLEKFDRS
jgi:hypothetical protein